MNKTELLRSLAQNEEDRLLLAQALDKLETILQHNQGSNPPDFDYAFNLGYGRRYTDATPLFSAIRDIVDADTQRRIDAGGQHA